MKWISATIRAIILFLSFIALNIMFNLAMQIVTARWENSNVALGAIPRAAIALHLFITQYTIAAGVIIFVFCLAVSFMEAARKKI